MEHLYNIIGKKLKTGQGPKIWVLNQLYCPRFSKDEIRVEYSYESIGGTPFSLEAIMDIDKYNFRTFKQAYLEERTEILDRDSQDMRISAVWSFYNNVKTGDIALLVSGNRIIYYYVITGEHVEILMKDNSCEHSWQAEEHEFGEPLEIKERFGSPFFKTLDGKLGYQVMAAIKSRLNLA